MSYELYQQGPGTYIPILLISFVITVLLYGAFPLILARTRKKLISKRKYNILCYGVNFLVMILFVAINGGASGAPYLLWTWVFTRSGRKTLENKGLLQEYQSGSEGDHHANDVKKMPDEQRGLNNGKAGNDDGRATFIRDVAHIESGSATSTPSRSKGMTMGLIVISVLLVVSIAFNMIQYVLNQNSVATVQRQLDTANITISDQRDEIADLEKKVSSQSMKINVQKSTISSLEDKADSYDAIINDMKQGNAGYASSNFFASDSVIVVSRKGTAKFTLTANWSQGGTVEVEYSSSAAWISFDNDEWYTSTPMTVHPLSKGVTVATFSNDVDSKTFKVLIIVTD